MGVMKIVFTTFLMLSLTSLSEQSAIMGMEDIGKGYARVVRSAAEDGGRFGRVVRANKNVALQRIHERMDGKPRAAHLDKIALGYPGSELPLKYIPRGVWKITFIL